MLLLTCKKFLGALGFKLYAGIIGACPGSAYWKVVVSVWFTSGYFFSIGRDIIISSLFASYGSILVGLKSRFKSHIKFVITLSQCFCALFCLVVVVSINQRLFSSDVICFKEFLCFLSVRVPL